MEIGGGDSRVDHSGSVEERLEKELRRRHGGERGGNEMEELTSGSSVSGRNEESKKVS